MIRKMPRGVCVTPFGDVKLGGSQSHLAGQGSHTCHSLFPKEAIPVSFPSFSTHLFSHRCERISWFSHGILVELHILLINFELRVERHSVLKILLDIS